MESIVNKLSEIEDAAVAIVRHTEVQKKEYDDIIQKKRKAFDDELNEQTATTLAGIRKHLQEEMEQSLSKLRAENEAAISAYEKEFEQYHEQYAAQILKRITEV